MSAPCFNEYRVQLKWSFSREGIHVPPLAALWLLFNEQLVSPKEDERRGVRARKARAPQEVADSSLMAVRKDR